MYLDEKLQKEAERSEMEERKGNDVEKDIGGSVYPPPVSLFNLSSASLLLSKNSIHPRYPPRYGVSDIARRFTYAEKGKGIAPSVSPNPRLRIRAPAMDTSDLVQKNALTLIGRLTNPAEQLMRSMLPYFSNKWELRGNVLGSDLGNGNFQFRFDYDDDLRKVLENRPYQYSRWMLILEKWEPVISPLFPSQIPFWISLRDLPLHYWKRELLLSIGDKIGKLQTYELTATAAKIRVEVNGLNLSQKRQWWNLKEAMKRWLLSSTTSWTNTAFTA
ncbi:unnamed protein product [Microthlaspi erraticum]|uniref:DUF4283 domain-containing protein n=1 Tax=Microthlaspi erraticum TaxID=1685480 RepID=A0A6D2LE89_9BRAS|nr:unnamed protein product [Microthlaspi erraticum]